MAHLTRTIIFAAFPLGLIVGSDISAQVAAGLVLDAGNGQAVAGADVVLVASNGRPVEQVLSDSLGAFFLTADATGIFYITAGRIGYRTVRSRALQLFRGDTTRVEVRIDVDAVVLDPLLVISEPSERVLDERLEDRGFYERQDFYGEKSGFGYFLEPEAIRRRNAFRTSDLLRGVTGLSVVSLGGRDIDVRSISNPRCRPKVYVDGTHVRIHRHEILDDIVMPSSIAAIEVYPRSVYPAQFAPNGCGSIVIWTGYAEGKYLR